MTLEGRLIGGRNLGVAMRNYSDANLTPTFMPALVRRRNSASKPVPIWSNDLRTLSGCYSGLSKQNNPVVVYVHKEHYFSHDDNVRTSISAGKVYQGSLITPVEEFYRLIDMKDDETVFVLDYPKEGLMFGSMEYDQAIKHPHLRPIFGVSEDEVIEYMKKSCDIFGRNRISLCVCPIIHTVPLGNLLLLGNSATYSIATNTDVEHEAKFLCY